MIALAARLLRRRIALFAVLVAASACAGALELRGFRGVAWGADVQSLGAAQQVSSGDGVQCFAPDGTLIGKIKLPEGCANVCFGMLRNDRLFMTATTSCTATRRSARCDSAFATTACSS